MFRRNGCWFYCLCWLATLAQWHHFAIAQEDGQDESTKPVTKELDIHFAPTPQRIVDLMLEVANIKETDLVCDLGCGDARIVVRAAEKYGCRGLGVELDPALVRESIANVKEANLEDLVVIEEKDIFKVDLSEVDVVTLYLLPSINRRLLPQLKKMKPGARVLSHQFNIFGVEPDDVVKLSSRLHGEHTIYSWTLPFSTDPIPRIETMLEDADGRSRQKPTSTGFSTVARYAPFVIAIMALFFAISFWLLRKNWGMVKLNVTFDRPNQPDEQSETPSQSS